MARDTGRSLVAELPARHHEHHPVEKQGDRLALQQKLVELVLGALGEALLGADHQQPLYWVPGDGHPNELAYQRIGLAGDRAAKQLVLDRSAGRKACRYGIRPRQVRHPH